MSATAPADVWREGCWWFVVYSGTARGRQVDIVFAVYLQARKPPIRVAVLDADTDTDTDHRPAGAGQSFFI